VSVAITAENSLSTIYIGHPVSSGGILISRTVGACRGVPMVFSTKPTIKTISETHQHSHSILTS
jgi:hypothetical protein